MEKKKVHVIEKDVNEIDKLDIVDVNSEKNKIVECDIMQIISNVDEINSLNANNFKQSITKDNILTLRKRKFVIQSMDESVNFV
jgi:hypothetical protein